MQRIKLLSLTASTGSIPNLELALDRIGIALSAQEEVPMLEAAARAGRRDMCEWLLKRVRGKTAMSGAMAAAKAGQQSALEGLLENGLQWKPCIVRAAATGGHRGLMDWLLLRHSDGPLRLEDCRAAFDQAEYERLLEAAAEGLDLPTLQLMYDKWRMAWDEQHQAATAAAAAAAAQVRRRERQPQAPTRVYSFSDDDWEQEGEQEDVGPLMQLLRHERETAHALQIIVYHMYGLPDKLLPAAARSLTPDWREKLEWLEELHEARTHKGPDVAAAAAIGPDAVARLAWLRQRAYTVDHLAAEEAARTGNAAALAYLIDEGQAAQEQGQRAVWHAAVLGRLGAIKVLAARGWPASPTYVAAVAAERGHTHIVAWAVDAVLCAGGDAAAGSRWLLDAAARAGSVELMERLWQHGCRGSERAYAAAAEGGCEEALEWVAAHGIAAPAPEPPAAGPAAAPGGTGLPG
ncbi:hypothetical protein GPECTOR_5g279 [Gonium pectorale]|uniref:Ankyrin repeat domain-containing protein n=1 Tax=Gonium pectorale TaxID=33097 RepID=A0A150GWN8_GONPE|nr:hypothetical protein GPECTOR_5g279 [Gonium pectorale]|eukprot:KXZ54183.1 hypothetical protein GPECTOR_5g279 [Gonium pectorale]